MSKSEYQRKWKEDNKKYIKKYYSTKVVCPECGKVVSRGSLSKHRKAIVHLQALKQSKMKALETEYEKRLKVLEEKIAQVGGSKSQKVTAKSVFKNKENIKKYAPNGFDTYKTGSTKLDKINDNEKSLKKRIKNLIKDGRVAITTRDQLINFPLGSLVSYVTNDGKYRSGGFLKSKKGEEYFVLQGGTVGKPISFSVQYSNVDTMYVRNVERIKEESESENEDEDEESETED